MTTTPTPEITPETVAAPAAPAGPGAPTTEQITATVLGIAAGELGTTLTPASDLRGVEGADSVKLLRIIARIEREYDLELEDEDVFGVATVAEMVTVLEKTLALQGAS